jgi:hypothetical protein
LAPRDPWRKEFIMKKIIAGLIVAIMLAGGFGLANNGQGAGQGCVVPQLGSSGVFKNPGEMFQFVRVAFGDNPAEGAARWNLTVGEAIATFCSHAE